MAQLSSIISAISKQASDDEPADIVGANAGFGSILGIIAAVIGLFAGISLVPITSFTWEITASTPDPFAWVLGGNTHFSGLLAVGLLLQALDSKDLRAKLGGMLGSVFYIGFISAILVAAYAVIGFSGVTFPTYSSLCNRLANAVSVLR